MSFSNQWDVNYKDGHHLSTWPWSDLVSYVLRYARPKTPEYRVLELGVGAGANVPLFERLKVDYLATDGSPFIIAALKEKFPTWQNRFFVNDFTKELPETGSFDLIFDRGALTANNDAGIRACIELVRQRLKPRGLYIGIDWYSVADDDFNGGEPSDDPFTKTNYTSGKFADIGRAHFFDPQQLYSIFEGFEFEALEHKVIEQLLPDKLRFASFNFACRIL